MSLITDKLSRIRAGGSLRTMDLFAGCGGLTLGFTSAGYTPIAFVELDHWAAETHRANFTSFGEGTTSDLRQAARDITIEEPASIFSDLGISGPTNDQIDVLIGGPPCQAFARVGRAKLRELAHKREEPNADYAFLVDGRVNLWERYVSYVRALRPIALLMENVPDILNHGANNVAELVSKSLSAEGYEVRYTLLNAAWYGTPQTRERMFLIGYHRDTGLVPTFPSPTHHHVLPRGYDGTRGTARKIIGESGSDHHRFVLDPTDELPPTTTAREALADLPPIYARELLKSGLLKRGAKNPLERCSYTSKQPTTSWSRLVRCWTGFESAQHTTGHVIRYLPRDFKIFAELQSGWQYPQIWQHVEHKISVWLERRQSEGLSTDPRNPEVHDFISSWRIPYDPSKFPNKWWVIDPDKPSRTLLAHLGKDSYSHIHFDSSQARPISLREAARLQGFPDAFVFHGSMNPALRQIGNAVPPLLAYAFAVAIRVTLGVPPTTDHRVSCLGLDPKSIRTTEGTEIPS